MYLPFSSRLGQQQAIVIGFAFSLSPSRVCIWFRHRCVPLITLWRALAASCNQIVQIVRLQKSIITLSSSRSQSLVYTHLWLERVVHGALIAGHSRMHAINTQLTAHRSRYDRWMPSTSGLRQPVSMHRLAADVGASALVEIRHDWYFESENDENDNNKKESVDLRVRHIQPKVNSKVVLAPWIAAMRW